MTAKNIATTNMEGLGQKMINTYRVAVIDTGINNVYTCALSGGTVVRVRIAPRRFTGDAGDAVNGVILSNIFEYLGHSILFNILNLSKEHIRLNL